MAYSRGHTLEDFLDLITYEAPNGRKRCAAQASLVETGESHEALHLCKTLASQCYLHFPFACICRTFMSRTKEPETYKQPTLSIPGLCALSPGITWCPWPRQFQGMKAEPMMVQQLGSCKFLLLFACRGHQKLLRNPKYKHTYTCRCD